MNKPIFETMKQYNEAIESYKRAEIYFAREDIELEEKQGKAQDCKILVNHINGLANKIKEMGYRMTDEEYLEGFRQIKFLNI